MRRSHRKQSKSMKWLKANLPKLLVVLLGTGALAGGLYMVTRKSPDDHLQAGIAMQEKGDLKGAAIELKNALQGMPDDAEARLRLGRLHFSTRDYESAEKELKRARELKARDPDLDPLYARTLLLLGEPQRLLDEVNVADGAPAEVRAGVLALRARAQLLLKDTTASDGSLQDAEQLQPNHPEVLITRALKAFSDKQIDDALMLVEKALAQAPKRSDFWFLKGELLRTAKQNEKALLAYQQALEIEPDNTSALLAKAHTHVEMSHLDKASNDLKKLRKLVPNNVMGRYLEAFIDFRHERFNEANDHLQAILRGVPGFLPGHLLAGTVNIALGNREAARFHLDKVLGAAPDHTLARKLMAATLADMGDLDRAKAMLATFGNAGADPLLNTLQGKIALRQGDYAEARKHLEQVPAGAAPNDARYFTELAASRMGSGDEAGAVAALSKAAELDTGGARPEVLLVLAHLKEKRYAEAVKVVDKLEKEGHHDPLTHNLRGVIFVSQEDTTKARASFAKALQVKADYFPAASNLALLDLQSKDSKAARGRFQQIVKANPKESRAWLALAELDARDGNETGYLNNLEQARRANEKLAQPHIQLVRYWLAKKNAGKALVEARSALQATGRVEFNEYIGLALMAQGDQVNAIATLSKWAEAQARNPLAHFRLAQAQLATKDQAGALKTLDKAIALNADYAEAALTKALVLGRMGRAEEGIRIARAWQTKAPKSAGGFLTQAEIQFDTKKYLEAAELFAKGAQLSNQGQPMVRAYQAYASAGQVAEGEKRLGEWLKVRPKDALVRHQLALSFLNGKQLRESAEQYRKLIGNNPKDVVAYNNLAWLLGELREQDAVAIAEQAYKLNPRNPATQDTLGWLLVNAGQFKRGVELLTAAHDKAPDVPEILWHLAAGLAKSGDHARAKQELEKLLYSGVPFAQKAEAKQLLDSLN